MKKNNNNESLTDYKAAIKELRAELAAWDKRDEENEPAVKELMDSEEMKAVRQEMGFSGAMDRTRIIIPVIIARFEDDRRNKPDEKLPAESITVIFNSIREMLVVIGNWLERNYSTADIEAKSSVPELEMNKPYLSICSRLREWEGPSIRFNKDINRLLPDLWILKGWILDFVENARRHGQEIPEEIGAWNEQEWCEYFWRNLKRRSSLVKYAEEHGFTEEALANGFQLEVADERRHNRLARNMVERMTLEEKLNAAWDPEKPEEYLDLKKIPEFKDERDDDFTIIKLDLSEEAEMEEGNAQSWRASIPKTDSWNDDESEYKRPPFTKDPVFKLLNNLQHKYFEVSKREWQHRQLESERDERYRPPLDQYFASLILNTTGVMIHALCDLEDGDKPQEQKGCYRFCAGVLERFAQVVDKNNSRIYQKLAVEARQTAQKILKAYC